MTRRTTARLATVGLAVLAGLAAWSSTASAHGGDDRKKHDTIVVHPGESIQDAVDHAKRGDKVLVLPGTYHEAVCVTTDGIELKGIRAVIRPPAQAPQTPCSFGPEGQLVGIALFGVVDFATGTVTDPIRDVVVSGFKVIGFAEFGIFLVGGKNVDIVGNTTVNNAAYGIFRLISTGGTIKNNKATGSAEAGIYLGDSPNARASIAGNTTWNNGLFGIFVRDSSHGLVVGNTTFDNCVGIIVLSTTSQPASDWTVKRNRVKNNTKACPAGEEGPPLSGLGIALAGAHQTKVIDNKVTGNVASGPSVATGGIAVFSTLALGGTDPVGNLIKNNRLANNEPDLSYDGSGSDNRFISNRCETSVPDGLCSPHH
jgi:parallel beta-helix repeat protein